MDQCVNIRNENGRCGSLANVSHSTIAWLCLALPSLWCLETPEPHQNQLRFAVTPLSFRRFTSTSRPFSRPRFDQIELNKRGYKIYRNVSGVPSKSTIFFYSVAIRTLNAFPHIKHEAISKGSFEIFTNNIRFRRTGHLGTFLSPY